MVKLSFYVFLNSLYFLLFSSANADQFRNSKYTVCFTPGENCTKLIVNTIQNSNTSLKIQGYSFTSAPIMQAVVDAQKRGIEVKVILDKSQFSDKYSASKFLLNHKIPVWKDHRVAIAHNKVMIVDEKIVITGSFNFTKAAQEKNAENILVIHDTELANKYTANWNKRMAFSDLISN